MPALAEEVKIQRPEHRTEGVGVFGLLDGAGPLDAQPVGAVRPKIPGEEARPAHRLQAAESSAVSGMHEIDPEGPGLEGPHPPPPAPCVRAQDRERIADAAGDELGGEPGLIV